MDRYYLGIDNGGTTTKASIYSKKGKEIASSTISTSIEVTKQNFAEIDMLKMKETIYSVIRNVLFKSQINPDYICGIAVCGHGKGLYLVDEKGNPVRKGILSSDTRALEYAQRFNTDGTAEKIYPKTHQKITTPQAVCLIPWLKDNEPDSIEKTRWVFECKDYVRFLLTGKAFAELTDYSGANLVNLNNKKYDPDLLEDLGISYILPCLPPLVTSTDRCGKVTNLVAEATGLKTGTPVFGGMFDIDACAIATGVCDTEHICMIAGTWSINEFLSERPVPGHRISMSSIFCDPKYYLQEESSPTSAVNLAWFTKTLLPEFAEKCREKGLDPYQEMDRLVNEVGPFEDYPIYLPFIMASNANPKAEACFIGMTGFQERAHLIKSIFEGVVFSHKYHLEKLLSGKTTETPSIRLSGGAANSAPWAQMFADILELPIEIVTVREAGTLGCAIAVSIAVGDYRDFKDATESMVRVSERITPHPEKAEWYRKRYMTYKQILSSLNSLWDCFPGAGNAV